tara:strand:+ start:132 stop:608 length:477 start_codon:yes stop_codon:yes gene_type:complete
MLASIQEDTEVKALPRKLGSGQEMDMTPMVDVTFLLLIFFMVTAAFSLQKSIEMPRQRTDALGRQELQAPPEEPRMVQVEINEFGGFLVMASGWQRETAGKQSLVTALKEAIEGHTSETRLVVKVHQLARLRSLVDAVDAGAISGYVQLEVTQVEGFE